MIKKIILAVTFGGIFILAFAAGVGCIIAGAGDFSWDIVSQYVSMSDITMINDTPISSLFSFSDHSEFVGSHAEGQVGCPTEAGVIILENIADDTTITASPDEFIHLTVDGKLRDSCIVRSAKNLTGKNIPDIQFEFNESTDEAIIKIRKLRGKEISLQIAIPSDFKGKLRLNTIAGKINADIPLQLAAIEVKEVAGELNMDGVSAGAISFKTVEGSSTFSSARFDTVTIADSAGKINLSGSIGGFKIDNALGRVTLESDVPLASNCKITNVMGTVDIKLPEGSKFKLTKKDIKGIVLPSKGDKKADFTISIENVVGKVSIDR